MKNKTDAMHKNVEENQEMRRKMWIYEKKI